MRSLTQVLIVCHQVSLSALKYLLHKVVIHQEPLDIQGSYYYQGRTVNQYSKHRLSWPKKPWRLVQSNICRKPWFQEGFTTHPMHILDPKHSSFNSKRMQHLLKKEKGRIKKDNEKEKVHKDNNDFIFTWEILVYSSGYHPRTGAFFTDDSICIKRFKQLQGRV